MRIRNWILLNIAAELACSSACTRDTTDGLGEPETSDGGGGTRVDGGATNVGADAGASVAADAAPNEYSPNPPAAPAATKPLELYELERHSLETPEVSVGCPWSTAHEPRAPGVQRCEPPGIMTCPQGHFFVFDGYCAPLGAGCPAEPWALLPAGIDVSYVLAGASPGGDGSQSTPFATIAEAVATAAPGEIIALAKGVYEEAVVLPDGVSLLGACVEETILRPSPAEPVPAIRVSGHGVQIAELQIIGGEHGIEVEGSSSLSSVLIDGARGAGLHLLAGAEVDGSLLLIRRSAGAGIEGVYSGGVRLSGLEIAGAGAEGAVLTGGRLSLELAVIQGSAGVGLQAREGAELELQQVRIDRSHGAGIGVLGPSSAWGYELAVHATLADAGGRAHGIVAEGGGSFEALDLWCSRNAGAGVAVMGYDSWVDLERATITDTVPAVTGEPAAGLLLQGGSLTAREVFVARTEGAALRAEDGAVELASVILAESLTTAPGEGGQGAHLLSGVRARLERVGFISNARAGLAVTGVDEVDAVEPLFRANGWGVGGICDGGGLLADAGAVVSVSAAHFAENTGAAVRAVGPETHVSLSWSRCVGTRIDPCGRATDLEVLEGAALNGGELVLEDSAGAGVYAEGSSDVPASDRVAGVYLDRVLVRGPRFSGLELAGGATAYLQEASFEHHGSDGISVRGEGSTVELVDVSIHAPEPWPEDHSGRGALVTEGASLYADRLEIIGARLAGLSISGPGSAASVVDLSISDTRGEDGLDVAGGSAIVVTHGAGVTLERALLERGTLGGILADGPGTFVEAEDLVVRESLGAGLAGLGRGLAVQTGARVSLLRGVFEANRDFAIVAAGQGATAQLEEVAIRGTTTAICRSSDCASPSGGVGVSSGTGATVVMTSFVVSRSEVAGLSAAGGDLVVYDGQVRDNTIGANTSPEYERSRLTRGVVYLGNGADFDSAPIPPPVLLDVRP